MNLKISKIILASLIATSISWLLGVDYGFSAGTIAMISVHETRQETLQVAKSRILWAIIALAIASFLFYFFGISLLTWALFLIIFVPAVLKSNAAVALIPSCVLVGQLYFIKQINAHVLINELIILLIGIGVATLINSYMPSQNKRIILQKQIIENKIEELLKGMANSLRLTQDNTANLTLANETQILLNDTKQIILHEMNNQLFKKSTFDLDYVEMRSQQLHLIFYMLENINLVKNSVTQSEILANLLDETANQVFESNSAEDLIQRVLEVNTQIRQAELPKTREEFELRAILFQQFNDLYHLLLIKKHFILKNKTL